MGAGVGGSAAVRMQRRGEREHNADGSNADTDGDADGCHIHQQLSAKWSGDGGSGLYDSGVADLLHGGRHDADDEFAALCCAVSGGLEYYGEGDCAGSRRLGECGDEPDAERECCRGDTGVVGRVLKHDERPAQPNSAVWKYSTGSDTNASLDILCAYGSSATPCDPSFPNSFVGTDGYLHIVAQKPAAGVYTSGRMESAGLFSFQYGRIEARIWVPEGQGIWPAFWLLGNNQATQGWPASGEMDVMERINAAGLPPAGTQKNPPTGTTDWNEGSIHGTGFTGSNIGSTYDFTGGQTAAGWHTYGLIKTPNSIAYYVDDAAHPYVTFTPSSIAGLSGSVWPFDNGQGSFLILNIAVGGSWPGSPDASTVFPAEMLVDYVRVYTN